jgi:hypothetical protein
MSDAAIVLLMLLTIAAGGAGIVAGYAMLAPQLRAMNDIATKQATHIQHQARTIAELEQYIADHSDGEATAEGLGYDGNG